MDELKKELYNALDIQKQKRELKNKQENCKWKLKRLLHKYLVDLDYNFIYCEFVEDRACNDSYINFEIDFRDEQELQKATELPYFKNCLCSASTLTEDIYLNKNSIESLFQKED